MILLGEAYVGKTSILSRFIGEKFSESYHCTIGVEYKIKSILIDAYTSAELKIWDTCGAEQFRSLTRQYYRVAQGSIIVFDLTKKETFLYIQKWIKELNNNGNANIPILIVGNKSDLSTERVVPIDEIKKK